MFLGGLDLGQAGDPSALAVLERTEEAGSRGLPLPAVYRLRALVRFALGLSYLDIVDEVHRLWGAYGLQGGDNQLAVDYTGVGRPVVDLFLRRGEIPVRPVTITGGTHHSEPQPGWYSVPKKELASVMQILLRSRRLQVAAGLKEAGTLLKELQNFKVKVTAAGNETFEAWRAGDHDDLVLATAMPCWLGEKGHLGAFDVAGMAGPSARGETAMAPPGVWGSAADEGLLRDNPNW